MPRRRRLKVGHRRRDAAYDAMRNFGFPDDLIRQTLNDLLKVYGDDGWAFIEEGCYKVLFEVLLDINDQALPNHDQKQLNCTENQPDQDYDNLMVLAEDNIDKQQSQLVGSVKQSHEIVEGVSGQENQGLIPDGDEQQNQLVVSVQPCQEPVKFVPELEDGGKEICGLEITESQLPVDAKFEEENQLTCKRKPCFGWISDDDVSENDDIVTDRS